MKRTTMILISILVLLSSLMMGCEGNQGNRISKEISKDRETIIRPSLTSEILRTGGGDYPKINNGFKRFIEKNWPYDTIFEIGSYVAFNNQVWAIRSIWGVRAWGTDLYGNFIFHSSDYGDNWEIQWHDTYNYMKEDLSVREIWGFNARDLAVLITDRISAPRKEKMIYTRDGGKTWREYASWNPGIIKQLTVKGETERGLLEQELAEKFTPILWLHPEEVYEPKEVGILVNHALIKRTSSKEVINLRDVPVNQRLEKLGSLTEPDWYLDYRLLSLKDGPDAYKDVYQKVLAKNYKTTVYARVTQESGKTILQYWFFYFFNDWVLNRHEGDWEMIQLTFNETDIQKILNTEKNIIPESVAYSQHIEVLGGLLAPGGTKEDWDSVEKEGTHPVVYVAQGSHANYFKPGKYLLNVPNVLKAGVYYALTDEKAADITARKGVGRKVMPGQIILLSDEPWLKFTGLWGEWVSDNSPDNGPRAPTQQVQWVRPREWSETREDDSNYWKSIGFYIPY